ncbi:unnamed protein product, partial [Tilletia laevis]
MSAPPSASKPTTANGETNGNGGSVPTPSASPAKSNQGAAPAYEPYFCHQHKGGTCHGPGFQCTYLRPSGKRCGFRFCSTGLREIGIDPQMMLKVGLNDLAIEVGDHTPLAHKYYLQCSRCRGSCQCETCVEAASNASKNKGKGKHKGASSQGGQTKGKGWAGFMEESSTNQNKGGAAKPKSSTSKKAAATNTKASASTSKGKKKDDAATKTNGAAPKGKGKDKEKVANQGPAKKAKTFNGQARKIDPYERPFVPRPPVPVLAPAPQVIETVLPMPNIEARIYLYETLVRLTDVIKVPKTLLGNLDRFEAWSSRQCQQLLERLLAAAAGLPYIDRGQPTKNTGGAIRAYREFGSQPLRGEPWEAARELIKKQLGRDVEDLPKVDRTAEEEREREEEDRLAAIAAAAEVPAVRVTRRMAAAEKRIMQRHEVGSDTEKSNGNGGRKTANSRSAAVSGPSGRTSSGRASSSLSRSRRKDLLGSDDEDDDDDDDDEDSVSSNGDRSGRQAQEDVDGDENMSDADSVASKESAGSAYQASDDEGGSNEAATVTAATSPPESIQAKKNGTGPDGATPAAPLEEPVPAPHMEAKIAILCGLCDVVLQTADAAKEIKAGIDGVVQAEREHKATMAQMEKEWVAKRDALASEAPSMAAENYADWKKK